MGAVYTSATFANPYEHRRRSLSYPFRDDPTLGTLITRHYEVAVASYSAPALNTVDSEFSSAYCVGVRNIDHVDGELMRYQVLFATIPVTRNEYSSYSYRFPGWESTFSPAAGKTITGIALSNDKLTAVRFCAGHGLSVGSAFQEFITFTWREGAETRTLTITTLGLVTEATDAQYKGSIYIPGISGVSSVTPSFASGTLYTGGGSTLPGRGPVTIPSHSRTEYSYILPGVSSGINSPTDIALPQPVAFVNTDGTETDILSTTSSPTAAAYQAAIGARQEFVAEAYFSNWMGNIFERAVRWLPYY
jgi:hypothetical protein